MEFKKCSIAMKEPLLLCDDRRLMLGDGRSIHWENRLIIHATHSKHHGVFMILCEDWKLYVLTENLDLLARYRWDSKYTVCLKFIEEISAFLMIGVSEVHLEYVEIKCNCKQTKFLSSMKCEINKKTPLLSVSESTKLKWHKGYEAFLAEDLLLVWSLQDVNFYSLKNLEILAHVENIAKKETPISHASYNTLYRYTIVGNSNGTIRLWKIPFNLNEKKELIHTFEFHAKPIVGIVESSDPRVFISQSVDCRLCFWNMDTFELVYTYDFSDECSKMYLCDHRYFYAEDDSRQLMRGSFGLTL